MVQNPKGFEPFTTKSLDQRMLSAYPGLAFLRFVPKVCVKTALTLAFAKNGFSYSLIKKELYSMGFFAIIGDCFRLLVVYGSKP